MPTDLAPIDPPLKWAGGKRWLLPRLREYYAVFRDRRLVEPFGGGLAVSLGLRPERALISDGNEHLIHFFRRLQQGLVIDRALVNEEAAYYAARKRLNELIRAGMQATEEAAGLFYYLNRTCYNGLCRFNSSGEFNVPFGRYKQINYTVDFGEYAPILRDWEFRFGDFEEILLQADDFIYADPPYDVDFTRYAKNDFTWADQERLAAWLAAHPGPVVASNQATPRILELYAGLGFAVETVLAPRMIACNGDRSKAVEMLAVRGM